MNINLKAIGLLLTPLAIGLSSVPIASAADESSEVVSQELRAQTETFYLLIRTDHKRSAGIALHSLPMPTNEKCEEQGAILIGSSRFRRGSAYRVGFECLEGK